MLITPDASLQTPTPLLLKCNFDIGMFTDLQASGSNKDLNLDTLTICPGQEIDQQQVISLPGFFWTFLAQSHWDTLGFSLHESADLGQGWWRSISCLLTKGFMAQVQDLASVSQSWTVTAPRVTRSDRDENALLCVLGSYSEPWLFSLDIENPWWLCGSTDRMGIKILEQMEAQSDLPLANMVERHQHTRILTGGVDSNVFIEP